MYNTDYHSYEDKTIIISGSSKGIGKTLARELGLMGAHIVLNGTNEKMLEETEEELKGLGIDCMAIAGNVANMDDCNRIAYAAIKQYNCIDMLFANAGITSQGSIEETSPAVLKKIMEVNFLGVVYLIKACLPALKKSKGKIMITGSASGFRGIPGAAAYSASKMALTAVADALKIELSHTGVYIGLAYVGFTQNDPGKTMLDTNGQITSKEKVAKGHIASQQEVVQQMIEMVNERIFKKTFSTLGKLNATVTKFAPWLGNIILKRHYLKSMARHN